MANLARWIWVIEQLSASGWWIPTPFAYKSRREAEEGRKEFFRNEPGYRFRVNKYIPVR